MSYPYVGRWGPPGGRVLKVQLAAKRRDIQKRIVADKAFNTTLVGVVRQLDTLSDAEEHANSLTLATLIQDFKIKVEVAPQG